MKGSQESTAGPSGSESRKPLASWYTPGLSDGLGDRLLMFDNSGAPSLELLRFRPELAAVPGFEAALRDRVERLRRFHHPSFAQVRAVERLGTADGLALVSNYTAGKRLSEVLARTRGPVFAFELLRQLTPALATLHQQADGIIHGLLAADRIVVTPEGRLVIVEHVLGSALARLGFSRSRLGSDLGVVLPAGALEGKPRLDARADILQLGIVALSLLAGRRIRPDEYPRQVAALLEQIGSSGSTEAAPQLANVRSWLRQALQLDARAFESAQDAAAALGELKHGAAETSARPEAMIVRLPPVESREEAVPLSADEDPLAAFDPPDHPAAAQAPVDSVAVGTAALPLPPVPVAFRPAGTAEEPGGSCAVRTLRFETIPRPSTPATEQKPAAVPQQPLRRRGTSVRRALTAAVAVLAVGEALVIAALLSARATPPAIVIEAGQPGTAVLVDGHPAGVTPLRLQVGTDTRLISLVTSEPAMPEAASVRPPDAERARPPSAPPDAVRAAALPRPGEIRVTSPIEVQVFEGGRRLGSSADASIRAAPGRHELELVNAAVRYRARHIVEVRPGEVIQFLVQLPDGRLSINAVPWAEVWMDGKLMGETPLGNLTVPLGEHEIVFRHPELGEQRQTAIVTSDGVTRVTANLQR